MLNEETNEAYENEMGRRRSSRIRKQSVDGRVWEELDEDGAFADGEYEDGGGSGAAGMANFTPEELADDYGLPFETVCEFMLLQLGIDKARLRDHLRQPVKQLCTNQQLGELLAFLGSADPIACRDALSEQPLSELAEEETPGLSAEQLLQLCGDEVAQVIGVEARISRVEYAILLERAEREIAFLGVADHDSK